MSDSSSVRAQGPPSGEVHVRAVSTTLFSSTRVAPATTAPPEDSVCTMEAFPGYMVALPLQVLPAPLGCARKPTRPADRCG